MPAAVRSILAYPPGVISGAPGTAWTNDSGKMQFQLHVQFSNSCARCITLANRVARWFGVPFHYGCVLPGTLAFVPEIKRALRAFYDGPATEVFLSDGSRFSVTANHMILTLGGFVQAAALVEGDKVIYCPELQGPGLGDPNKHDRPSLVDDVFRSFAMNGRVSTTSVPVSPEDLHGDAALCNGQIDVVTADGFLGGDLDSPFSEHFGNDPFDFRNAVGIDSNSFSAGSDPASILFSLRNATDGGVGILREAKAILLAHSRKAQCGGLFSTSDFDSMAQERVADGLSGKPYGLGNSQFGFSGEVPTDDLLVSNVVALARPGLVAHRYPGFFKSASDGCISDPLRIRDTIDRLPGGIQARNLSVVELKSSHYIGPVYDFETVSSLYWLGSGIASSNCNCTNVPVPPGTEALPFLDYQKEMEALTEAEQANAMGAGVWKLVKAGKVDWTEAVRTTRILSLQEVSSRMSLSLKDLTEVGIHPATARRALAIRSDPKVVADAAARQVIREKLHKLGVSDQQIAEGVTQRILGGVRLETPGPKTHAMRFTELPGWDGAAAAHLAELAGLNARGKKILIDSGHGVPPAPMGAEIVPGYPVPILPDRPIVERMAAYTEGDRKVAELQAILTDAHALKAKIQVIQDELHDFVTQAKANGTHGSKEVDAGIAKRYSKLVKAEAKYDEAARSMRERALPILKNNALPANWSVDLDATASAKVRKSLDDSLAWINDIVVPGGSKEQGLVVPVGMIDSTKNEDRAHFDYRINKVMLSNRYAPSEALHEIAHFMEKNVPGFAEAEMQFWKHRVGNEPEKPLSEFAAPGKMVGEMGRDDEFGRAIRDKVSARYAGKVYNLDPHAPLTKNPATGKYELIPTSGELMSIGLQYFYADPVGFATKDPEWAKFMLGNLDGSLRAPVTGVAPKAAAESK